MIASSEAVKAAREMWGILHEIVFLTPAPSRCRYSPTDGAACRISERMPPFFPFFFQIISV